MTCKATKRNGKPCKQTEMLVDGYCKYHNTPKYRLTEPEPEPVPEPQQEVHEPVPEPIAKPTKIKPKFRQIPEKSPAEPEPVPDSDLIPYDDVKMPWTDEYKKHGHIPLHPGSCIEGCSRRSWCLANTDRCSLHQPSEYYYPPTRCVGIIQSGSRAGRVCKNRIFTRVGCGALKGCLNNPNLCGKHQSQRPS